MKTTEPGMGVRIFYIILFCVGYAFPGIYGQERAVLPVLEPSYVNSFYNENDSYSKKCFSDIYFDRNGRLWLTPCGNERLINSIGLFRFDGYSFQPVELFTQEGAVLEAPFLRGFAGDGRFFGLTESKQLFVLEADTRTGRIVSPADLQAIHLSTDGREVRVLADARGNQIALYRMEGDTLIRETGFSLPSEVAQSDLQKMFLTREDIWLTGPTLPLLRVDRRTKSVRAYDAGDFIGHVMKGSHEYLNDQGLFPEGVENPGGNFIFSFRRGTDSCFFSLTARKTTLCPWRSSFPMIGGPPAFSRTKPAMFAFFSRMKRKDTGQFWKQRMDSASIILPWYPSTAALPAWPVRIFGGRSFC